jgi:uncharacterized membrane protein
MGNHKFGELMMPRLPLLVIAFVFLSSGIAHFVLTDFYAATIPDYMGYHRELVAISGLFELLGAIGILVPQTRLWAGYGLIALIVAVYPANINMALHPEKYQNVSKLLLYVRLPMQFLFGWFVWWAISINRQRIKEVVI